MRRWLALLGLVALTTAPALGTLTDQQLNEVFELLGRHVRHEELRGVWAGYRCQAEVIALVRRPTLGIISVRGDNQWLIRKLVVETPGLEAVRPLLASLGGEGLPARIEELEIRYQGTSAVKLSARAADLRKGTLSLEGGSLSQGPRRTNFSRAVLREGEARLLLEDGTTLSWSVN